MSKSNYMIIEDSFMGGAFQLVIKDIGPWDQYMTVTNNAEQVVEELLANGKLVLEQRLFYYDSEGQLDELLVKDGKFAGFAPGPT